MDSTPLFTINGLMQCLDRMGAVNNVVWNIRNDSWTLFLQVTRSPLLFTNAVVVVYSDGTRPVNELGVAYYNRLINALLKAGECPKKLDTVMVEWLILSLNSNIVLFFSVDLGVSLLTYHATLQPDLACVTEVHRLALRCTPLYAPF